MKNLENDFQEKYLEYLNYILPKSIDIHLRSVKGAETDMIPVKLKVLETYTLSFKISIYFDSIYDTVVVHGPTTKSPEMFLTDLSNKINEVIYNYYYNIETSKQKKVKKLNKRRG